MRNDFGAAQQSANVSGSYNIVVQASGDEITIDINRPHLTLAARHRPARRPNKYLDLLNPFNRAIPMVGRDRELQSLEAWRDGEAAISARCLIGGAGSGKTRLALELCAAAERLGWFAGFVDHRELDRFHGHQNLSAWDWPKPTLIVVDYAAAKARILRQWLAELVQRQGNSPNRLRLLLLERHAQRDLGWWPELTTPGNWAQAELGNLFDPPEPIPLINIADVENRRQILKSVVEAASRVKGLGKPLLCPQKGEDPDFDRRLADRALEFAPLHLLMAGIPGVEHNLRTPLLLGPTKMAEDLANFELGRIDVLAQDRGLNPDFLRYLAAGLTLAGGCSRDDLVQMIAEEAETRGFTGDRAEVEQALLNALPGEQPNLIAPVLPDLIGEAAVIKVMCTRSDKQQIDAVKRWHKRAPKPVLSSVIRIIQDYAVKDDHPALKWFDAIVEGTNDLATLMAIASQMPERTVALAERAARLYVKMVAAVRPKPDAAYDQEATAILAGSLNNLATRLSDLGQREQALKVAQEAVDIRRELAATRPDAFRPDLAGSLNNLANQLSDLGQREQALEAAQEAVELYRELAATRPDAFRPDLAMSLNNLAGRLSDLGQREQALKAAQEAVDIRRELAATRPDAFRPYLARSLSVMADCLENVGRDEEAIYAGEQAVATLSPYFVARPAAFLGLMRAMVRDYVRRCGKAGREPDTKLLEPILGKL